MLNETPPITNNDSDGEERMSDTSNEEYEDALDTLEAEDQSQGLPKEIAPIVTSCADAASPSTSNEAVAYDGSESIALENPQNITTSTNTTEDHTFSEDDLTEIRATQNAYEPTRRETSSLMNVLPESSVDVYGEASLKEPDASDDPAPGEYRQPLPSNPTSEQSKVDLDLLSRIPGLFRILNSCTDSGSNGGVDKVVIDQDGLGRAMNTIREGSYRTVSRINFSALDEIAIRPIGIYGSKSAIVEFLLDLRAIDIPLAEQLNKPLDRKGQLVPYLRSGLYLLIRPSEREEASPSYSAVYIIYWPDDETWNDEVLPNIQKNRVTFMRFLTKLASDIRSLISDEHANAFVWKYDGDQGDCDTASGITDSDDESDDDDRFVKFEVTKKRDEEEGVQDYPGFTFQNPSLATHDHENTRVQLVPGETSQAFVVIEKYEQRIQTDTIKREVNGTWLRSELKKHQTISLGAKIDQGSMGILFELGAIPPEANSIYNEYKSRDMRKESAYLDRQATALAGPQSEWPQVKRHLEANVRRRFGEIYSILEEGANHSTNSSENAKGYLDYPFVEAPEARSLYERYQAERVPTTIDSSEYKGLKKRFIDVLNEIEESGSVASMDRRRLISSIVSGERVERVNRSAARNLSSGWNKLVEVTTSAAVSLFSDPGRSSSTHRKLSRGSLGLDDGEFLDNLAQYSPESEYAVAIQAINDSAKRWLEDQIQKRVDKIAQEIQKAIETSVVERTFQDYCAEEFSRCMERVRGSLASDPSQPAGFILETLERLPATRLSERKYFIHAIIISAGRPSIKHTLTRLEVKADDIRLLDDDPLHAPSPSASLIPVTRETDINDSIIFVQLLNHGRKILHVLQTPGQINIYLNDTRDPSFRRTQKMIAVRQDRRLLFAVDEQTRLLALVYVDQESSRSFIQTFVMDKDFATLQQRGPLQELTHWYNDGPPFLSSVCFFCGSEDICILEQSGRIRIFSLQVQTFRPGIVSLSSTPIMMQSSPDGTALLVVERPQSSLGVQVRVFHQASFGQKHEGICVPLPEAFNQAHEFTVSSIGRRNYVYLIAHLPSSASLVSTAIRIRRNEAEYLLGHKQAPVPRSRTIKTNHNSLVDCFYEVWERFPIVPAIARDFSVGPSTSITFIQYGGRGTLQRVPRYFKSMIREFTSRCQKPTEGKLDGIEIQVESALDVTWTASQMHTHRAGEWFVELICLIPVHIAVARDNRFVPLKDGMSSDGLAHKLLGSEVEEIIDEITLGPYEAVLGSYKSTKPVRVVSSMGEQSVGKSFSLNHLVDTSFAGSAMRTTEGVWLSLCPTKDEIVIALDFEGVHSLERTSQEDMLLVLFNAAISNLVMFRNNFALSRNIANMFTSFQAGTRQFDPDNNPTLFKGLLAIIIKDVVDADKTEIVEEFRSKFNEIVRQEQGDNFITLLHDSQLAVMPWDVIQSKGFYTRFKKLSKHLFKQPRTHANAGEFLFTLKTLMAKLTTQDWGAIDHTLIRHRTSIMLTSLEQALVAGQGDVGPDNECEALKNYDTQQILSCQDTDAIFYLGSTDDGRQERLSTLLAHLGAEPGRHVGANLQGYLDEIAKLRIQHVRQWVDSNIARFMPSDNADIKVLQRELEDLSRRMLANLQLCLNKCGVCQLRCMRPKAHSAGDHDCGTSHFCRESCDFCQSIEDTSVPRDQREGNVCGFSAGHDGGHICKPDAHVCGKLCNLIEQRGCQETCVKPIGHEDNDHICAALRHQCGQPCELQGIMLHDGHSFSCDNACVRVFDEPHERHTCGDERFCPVRCELCPRYCAMGDHFHGLEPGAIHLCGQEHPCRQECELPGTCEIVQKPESIEVVYRGIHDTFSYTRYTQIARRLLCTIPIPPGQRIHAGRHVHSTEEKAMHFCEAQCSQCGYICHLPYAHPQREHETAHGSMQNTIWAIESSGDPVVEVEGHRFGAQDSGAPQLCSMYCKHRGRHVHLEFCRSFPGFCQAAESEHVRERMVPEPDRPKDWVSHRLFWERTGFKDPYDRKDQAEFGLCDSMCPGIEHQDSGGNSEAPSWCTLPIFHAPEVPWDSEATSPSIHNRQLQREHEVPSDTPPGQLTLAGPSTHISTDGHRFNCPDPSKMIPAFHIIFLLDCSSSMKHTDRRPLPNQPVTRRIEARHNNRFGAVLSALYQFLQERSAANPGNARRDAYSVLVFNEATDIKVENDMTSSIDQLMDKVLLASPSRGSNFSNALSTAQQVLENSWSAERAPVVIFLSDGEGRFDEGGMRDLCNRAVTLGTPLSFWSIAFGPSSRVLRAMANTAKDVASHVPRGSTSDPVPSSFCAAIDTVQLAQAFSNIATSLRRTRASLINPTAPSQGRSRESITMLLM